MNYHKMLNFEPNSVEGIQGLGIAFFQMQRFDSAEYYFNKVLQMSPDEPTTLEYLGATYLNGKKYPQSLAIFKKLIALNPNDLNAYSNMGKAFYFSQQYAPAIETFNKELSIDQRAGLRDLPYIALSYEKMGNMDAARKYEAMAKQVYSNFKLE